MLGQPFIPNIFVPKMLCIFYKVAKMWCWGKISRKIYKHHIFGKVKFYTIFSGKINTIFSGSLYFYTTFSGHDFHKTRKFKKPHFREKWFQFTTFSGKNTIFSGKKHSPHFRNFSKKNTTFSGFAQNKILPQKLL